MGWTIKTLRKHFNFRFKSIDKARKIAKKLMNERLNSMNEIREQLDRQIETFVTKVELKLLEQRFDGLSKLVYIGFGIFIVLQIILIFVLNVIFKK